MPFKIEVYGRNLEITERIKDYVTKKVAKLERFLNDIEEARVDLSYVKSARSSMDRQIAQVTLRGRGFILRTEERSDDIFTAFDSAVDKMQRQLKRYKEKHRRGRGDGRSAAEVSGEPLEYPEDKDVGVIVRRKSFELVPMSEKEALEQMKLLGHESFFVFFNSETNSINVLYLRRDGTYGLIEPRIRGST